MRAAIEESQRQPLELGEDILTQHVHRALGHSGHEPGLEPGEQTGKRVDADHQQNQPEQTIHIARGDVIINRPTHQVRAQHLQTAGAEDEEGCQHQA